MSHNIIDGNTIDLNRLEPLNDNEKLSFLVDLSNNIDLYTGFEIKGDKNIKVAVFGDCFDLPIRMPNGNFNITEKLGIDLKVMLLDSERIR